MPDLDPVPDLTPEELDALKSSTSKPEWFAIVENVKRCRGGMLPLDWVVKVIASGLALAKEQAFDGVAPDNAVTDEETLRLEAAGLQVMMEDLFMAALAIQTAIGCRAAHMVVLAIAQTDGFVCDVVVEKDGKQQNQRTMGSGHIAAMIQCGKQIHVQLMLLHQNTGKLQAYVDRVKHLDNLKRLRTNRIVTPGGN